MAEELEAANIQLQEREQALLLAVEELRFAVIIIVIAAVIVDIVNFVYVLLLL